MYQFIKNTYPVVGGLTDVTSYWIVGRTSAVNYIH